MWQRYVFEFCVLMSTIFNVDVSTKLHRLICHLYHGMLKRRYLCQRSSSENEKWHEKFKEHYNTDTHLDSTAPQLLTRWVHPKDAPHVSSKTTTDSDRPIEADISPSFSSFHWSNDVSHVTNMVYELSGHNYPRSIG